MEEYVRTSDDDTKMDDISCEDQSVIVLDESANLLEPIDLDNVSLDLVMEPHESMDQEEDGDLSGIELQEVSNDFLDNDEFLKMVTEGSTIAVDSHQGDQSGNEVNDSDIKLFDLDSEEENENNSSPTESLLDETSASQKASAKEKVLSHDDVDSKQAEPGSEAMVVEPPVPGSPLLLTLPRGLPTGNYTIKPLPDPRYVEISFPEMFPNRKPIILPLQTKEEVEAEKRKRKLKSRNARLNMCRPRDSAAEASMLLTYREEIMHEITGGSRDCPEKNTMDGQDKRPYRPNILRALAVPNRSGRAFQSSAPWVTGQSQDRRQECRYAQMADAPPTLLSQPSGAQVSTHNFQSMYAAAPPSTRFRLKTSYQSLPKSSNTCEPSHLPHGKSETMPQQENSSRPCPVAMQGVSTHSHLQSLLKPATTSSSVNLTPDEYQRMEASKVNPSLPKPVNSIQNLLNQPLLGQNIPRRWQAKGQNFPRRWEAKHKGNEDGIKKNIAVLKAGVRSLSKLYPGGTMPQEVRWAQALSLLPRLLISTDVPDPSYFETVQTSAYDAHSSRQRARAVPHPDSGIVGKSVNITHAPRQLLTETSNDSYGYTSSHENFRVVPVIISDRYIGFHNRDFTKQMALKNSLIKMALSWSERELQSSAMDAEGKGPGFPQGQQKNSSGDQDMESESLVKSLESLPDKESVVLDDMRSKVLVDDDQASDRQQEESMDEESDCYDEEEGEITTGADDTEEFYNISLDTGTNIQANESLCSGNEGLSFRVTDKTTLETKDSVVAGVPKGKGKLLEVENVDDMQNDSMNEPESLGQPASPEEIINIEEDGTSQRTEKNETSSVGVETENTENFHPTGDEKIEKLDKVVESEVQSNNELGQDLGIEMQFRSEITCEATDVMESENRTEKSVGISDVQTEDLCYSVVEQDVTKEGRESFERLSTVQETSFAAPDEECSLVGDVYIENIEVCNKPADELNVGTRPGTFEDSIVEGNSGIDKDMESEEDLQERRYIWKKMLVSQEKRKKMTDEMLNTMLTEFSPKRLAKKLLERTPNYENDPLEGPNRWSLFYGCYLCPFTSLNESKVMVHWTMEHLESKPYLCKYCPCDFRSTGDALKHVVYQHPTKKMLIALKPSRQFRNRVNFEMVQRGSRSKNLLLPAMVSASPAELDRSLTYKYVCRQCGIKMSNVEDIQRHVKAKHLNVKPYRCMYCKTCCRSVYSIRDHMQTEHSDRPVRYRIDSELVGVLKTIKIKDFYHLVPEGQVLNFVPEGPYWETRMSETNVRHACRICGHEARQKDTIWEHVILKHCLPYGVYCTNCMAYHVLSQGERDSEFMVCDRCDDVLNLGFSSCMRDRVLKLQLFYKCVHCGFRTKKNGRIEDHLKMRHFAVYPYSCCYCSFIAAIKMTVTEHMRYAHPLHPKARVKKDMSKAQAVARAIKRLYRVCYAVTDTSDLTCLAAFTKRDGQHVWLKGNYNKGSNWEVEVIADEDSHVLQDKGEELKSQHQAPDRNTAKLTDVVRSGPEKRRDRRFLSGNCKMFLSKNCRKKFAPGRTKDFSKKHHFLCTICRYRCLDRSCMARHVKYKHLRIHPHTCPYCPYSNVERTKVKIHVHSVHRDNRQGVLTSSALVTAVGEESKKHFVFVNGKVPGNGTEYHPVNKIKTKAKRLKHTLSQAATAEEPDLSYEWEEIQPETDMTDVAVTNQPTDYIREPEGQDNSILHEDTLSSLPVPQMLVMNKARFSSSLLAQMDDLPPDSQLQIKEELPDYCDSTSSSVPSSPFDSSTKERVEVVMHMQRTTEDMEVDMTGSENFPGITPNPSLQCLHPKKRKPSREDSILYSLLTNSKVSGQPRRKRRRRFGPHGLLVPSKILQDPKLTKMTCKVVLEDIISVILTGV